MSNQALIQLGSYTFAYNPLIVKRDTPRAIAYQETVSSGFIVDYGVVNFDRTITYKWPLMDQTMYATLFGLYTATSSVYTLIDDYSNTYSVSIFSLTYESELEGGVQAYVDVEMKMQVISGTP